MYRVTHQEGSSTGIISYLKNKRKPMKYLRSAANIFLYVFRIKIKILFKYKKCYKECKKNNENYCTKLVNPQIALISVKM